MSANEKASMTAEMDSGAVGRRAGWRLAAAYPGSSKDKRIARDLGCSPAMAKLLRHGRGWTLKRLVQCWHLYGGEFITHLFSDDKIVQGNADFARRLQALEEVIHAQRSGAHAAADNPGVASPAALSDRQGLASASHPVARRPARAGPVASPKSNRVERDEGPL